MHLSKQKINAIRSYFQDKPVLKAYLFGSFARGEADRKSDVDILVELDWSQKIGLFYVQMQLDLEEILHRKVDFVAEDGLSPYIRPHIEADKVLIYERIKGEH
ncbi:MAG: nucleotidyltransferase domain-containing protein [Saprospiraceae bacterium]|nr:nucleotidyltransferase domain-containing protein [Saprospiraceae bacterium]